MRGQNLFRELVSNGETAAALRKGRSQSLIGKRNDCLIARYYHYGYCRNKCYEDTIRLLGSEFYLSGNTIIQIVQNHTEQVQELKRSKPSKQYFQRRWPHLKW